MAYCSQLCQAPKGASLVIVTEMANLNCLSSLPDVQVSEKKSDTIFIENILEPQKIKNRAVIRDFRRSSRSRKSGVLEEIRDQSL
jgi:hypothetical protein